MPPKEDLFQSFEHHVTVRRAKPDDWPILEWQQFGSHIFFRPLGTIPEIVWHHSAVHSTDIWTKKSQEIREDFARNLSYYYRRLEFSRLVPLDQISDVSYVRWAFARITDSGAKLHIGILGNSRLHDEWSVPLSWVGDKRSFLEAPLQFFVESVAQALRDNAAEWQNTIKWARVDDETRLWAHVSWKNGNKIEWLALVRALLQLALLKMQWASSGGSIFILRKPKYNFSLLRMNRARSKWHYPAVVWLLLGYMETYFEARIDHTGLRIYPESPSIQAEKPSHHELMEALELWRDFGRKSGQLTQVEACLQQLLT